MRYSGYCFCILDFGKLNLVDHPRISLHLMSLLPMRLYSNCCTAMRNSVHVVLDIWSTVGYNWLLRRLPTSTADDVLQSRCDFRIPMWVDIVSSSRECLRIWNYIYLNNLEKGRKINGNGNLLVQFHLTELNFSYYLEWLMLRDPKFSLVQ